MSDINTDGWKDGDKVTITRGCYAGHTATILSKGWKGWDHRAWRLDIHYWDNIDGDIPHFNKYTKVRTILETNHFTDGWMEEEHRLQLYKLWNKQQ
jgi:hypothetical protein